MKIARSIFAALALSIGSYAFAGDEHGFYGGIGLGAGLLEEADNVCDTLRSRFGAVTTECNDSSLAGRAFLGYRWNSYIGAEIGYDYLGRYNVDGFIGGRPGTAEAHGHAFDALAVGTLPLGTSFAVFAKGGAAWYSVEVSGSLSRPVVQAFLPH